MHKSSHHTVRILSATRTEETGAKNETDKTKSVNQKLEKRRISGVAVVKGAEKEKGDKDDDDCPPCLFGNIKPKSQKPKMLQWRRPHIKTFPCLKELDVPQETPEQKALRRLRSRLRPFTNHPTYQHAVSLSDIELLAWLKTFDLNVYMVEAKLKKHCETRRIMRLDDILTDFDPPKVLQYHYTCGLCGEDRQKRPVWYELLGKMDMDSLAKTVPRDDLIRHKFYQLEMIKKEAKRSNSCEILVVVDMKGMPDSAFGPSLEIWREYINIVQDNYPYLVHEFIILHPPTIFAKFTLSLRPYLNRITRSKITVLGYNFLKYLERRIEMYQIPAYLGGYRCDIDNSPFCKEDLTWDGTIPRWMHTYPRNAANIHKLTIPGGERLVKETHVVITGSHVYWTLLELNQPVTISVYLNRIADDCCVVKEQRVDLAATSSTNHVVGTISEGAGRYLMVVDNCKNFASPAKGLYRIQVKPPIWLLAHLAEKKPLGEMLDLSSFIGEEEREWRLWKLKTEPHFIWKQDFPPIART